MKLSDGEKLILIMLSEIYENLQLDGDIDPKFIMSAIHSNNIWGINWKYSGIPFQDNDTPTIVKEVVDILDMWSFIEDSYEKLSKKDKLLVEKEAEPFGKNPKFLGFDGNNETSQMGIALFLINDLDRFQKYKGRNMNSHMHSIDAYQRMYKVFEPIRSTLTGNLLNTKQLVQILLAKVYPDNK